MQHGTVTVSGYHVQSISEDETTESYQIADETGDVDTFVHSYGIATSVTLEVVAKTGTAAPAMGDVFTYTSGKDQASAKINITGVSSAEATQDAMRWSITGMRFPGVTIT